MDHPAVQSVCSIASSNIVTQSIIRHFDQFPNSHTLEPVYMAHLFTSPIQPQQNSRLLSLPPEVRLQIYGYVFDSGLSLQLGRRAYVQLALLETCRLLHSEAHKLAFNQWYFHVLDGPRMIKGTPFFRRFPRRWNAWKVGKARKSDARERFRKKTLSQRLWTLGARVNHLRFVGITMPHSKLDPLSANNPFLLTRLPLTELTIGLTGSVGGHWKSDVKIYFSLISSLLYLSRAINSDGPLQPIYTLKKERMERFIALHRWTYEPQPVELHRMLGALETKKVTVRATQDVLWKAFVYFGLIHRNAWKVVPSDSEEDEYMHFVDEEAFSGGGVLEFGRLGKRKGGLRTPTRAE
ncbi:uncharacterized protein N0V89_010656 [Didymosphaeria variabile]|uniref:F-box domain-containing protein n=1 Tax=Didymosphaeria variabile TaxID=1932322 RepID=A0A9W8XD89_9PLEO|nr:uncharacterized protein N0V89_010656 [Didymosphaeria variabile]KAJ4346724.1 hypothetical protein N0V89_010656 [Didymosphaeria variabile]